MPLPLGSTHAPAEISPDREKPPALSSEDEAPPALSVAENERFWNEGRAAYPPQAPTSQPESRPYLKLPDDTCCEGVDVPAVGLVHTFDCKQSARPVLRASQVYVPSEVPQPLRDMVDSERGGLVDAPAAKDGFTPNRKEIAADGERERAGDGIRPRGLRLTEAARKLRQAAADEIAQLSEYTWSCSFCGSSTTGLDKCALDIVHLPDCWVGNALIVLEDFRFFTVENVVRPQPIDLLCMECGGRGGSWQQGPQISFKGWTLHRNQRLALDAAGTGRYIWTHECQNGGAQ